MKEKNEGMTRVTLLFGHYLFFFFKSYLDIIIVAFCSFSPIPQVVSYSYYLIIWTLL